MKFSRMRSVWILCALALASPARAQEVETPWEERDVARNSVYVELLGNALFYSVNYDRKFTDR